MVCIERIRSRAKKKRRSLSYLCEKLDVKKVYFNDIEKNGREIPLFRLEIIARELETTVDYLCGKTDDPEIPSNPNIIDLSSLSEAKKNVILLVLNSDDEFLKSQMSLWKSEKSTDGNK